MNVHSSLSILQSALQPVTSADDVLTFAEVMANIPRDPASIFAYLLVAGVVAAVIWFGRPRG